jgi:2-phosphoglycerate kinase
MDHPEKPQTSGRSGVLVIDGPSERPFMRGILVHSLMARELPFDDALRVAGLVGDALQGRLQIERADLAEIVQQIVGREYPEISLLPAAELSAIDVRGRSGAGPFSKGRLSQSLLASAVDPSDAFDVAREIEVELHRRGIAEIGRADLRRMAFKALDERFGSRTAERYLTWRHYQEPERPVVILIGGTTGAGKTSVALEVALRLGISRVLSTDSIRQIMRMLIPRELVPALHVSSFDAHRELPTAREGGNPVVDGFINHASAVAIGVRAMIERSIEENASLILDGVPLAPGTIDLEDYADGADVIQVILARLDETAFRSHFVTRAERERHRDSQRYLENLDAILGVQEYLLGLAEDNDVPIIDNVAVDQSVRRVIEVVVDTLRKKKEVDLSSLLL